MSINKATSNLVRAANSQAKGLEEHQRTGVSQIDIMSAKNTLTMLKGAKANTSGQKASLTRAVNRLSEAIAEAKVNPNVREVPGGGGTGPVIGRR